ncbi:hypothetical protein FHETE_7257 [Fusarium heterosporum]|uniref:Ubiquitin-like protease family profile domain-containing protein n=1 Tax=Fusarium heterosporum TaxID=42747 RepID=A0A8H5T6M6_FUSHE|nr:hypothetical protein FHETE_7257 [Fusarium heterosporum]
MLQSNDITWCAKLFSIPAEWKIFDAGYPLRGSTLAYSPSGSHLVFFVNNKQHWSLVHLDVQQSQLNHYNSLETYDMPISGLKDWILKQPAIKVADEIIINEKKCTQQKDGINCGIFALAFLKSLVEDVQIPPQVDCKALRDTWSSHLETSVLADPDDQYTHNDHRTSLSTDDYGSLDSRLAVTPVPTPHGMGTMDCFQQFLVSLKRDQSRLEKKEKELLTKRGELSDMQQNLESCQQKLEEEEKLLRGLQEQARSTENAYQKCETWLDTFPEGNNSERQLWLNEIESKMQSYVETMMEESESLRRRCKIAEESCENARKEIQKIQTHISRSKEQQLATELIVSKFKEEVAKIKQQCADVVGDLSVS